jgi:acetyl-CoA carboxylase biotin carboxylase subunit
MFQKILIANRGEIACRVIRACREMGIQSVAIYSQADAASRHVLLADEAICVGEATNTDSYLNLPNVLAAVEATGADAVHPGYGYFSERDRFAEALASLGVKFIGPNVAAIRSMGDKASAKQAAIVSECPVVPGSSGVVENEQDACKIADEIGYPVLLRAAAGGESAGWTTRKSLVANGRPHRLKPWRALATTRCWWSAAWWSPGTWKSRFWPTSTATACTWANANARSRTCATKKSWRKPPAPFWTKPRAERWAKPPCG